MIRIVVCCIFCNIDRARMVIPNIPIMFDHMAKLGISFFPSWTKELKIKISNM